MSRRGLGEQGCSDQHFVGSYTEYLSGPVAQLARCRRASGTLLVGCLVERCLGEASESRAALTNTLLVPTLSICQGP